MNRKLIIGSVVQLSLWAIGISLSLIFLDSTVGGWIGLYLGLVFVVWFNFKR